MDDFISFLLWNFNYFIRFDGEDEKQKKSSANVRSAVTDVTKNMLKLMNAVISEAGNHLNDLEQHEPEVAVVNPHDQPEFMHNLLFR